MKKIYTFLTALLLFSASYAYADHLGPIVFGEERTESVLFCESESSAMAFAKDEERSLSAGETVEQYLENMEKLMQDAPCFSSYIWYIPQETLYQWQGRRSDPAGNISLITMSLVKSQAKKGVRTKDGVVWTDVDVFVITPESAPPPQKK